MRQLALTEWGERLADLTGEQIKHGLDNWRDKWPPNVEAFRNACTGGDDWQHNTAAYRAFPPGLPKPKAKRETAERELAKIRIRPQMTPAEMEQELQKLRRNGL